MTECSQSCFPFAPHFSRDVVARFDGGQITTEAGALLLRPVEQRTGILRQFAACFRDYRRADLVEHSVSELVRQRVYGIALGYEDLNDHDQLRQDPLLALLSGKRDVEGEHRRREQDRGKAGAGKSTLNRLELTPADAKPDARYKKIVMDEAAVDRLLVDLYIQAQPRQPKRIVLDLDATDDPVHGEQEGRFFHGYYGCYCYLPLYIFIDEHLVCARLRPSNIDASAGSLEEVQRIVKRLRFTWPEAKIILRADSGFCRDALMSWCEKNRVGYVFGLAKNERLGEEAAQADARGARRSGRRRASRPAASSTSAIARGNPGSTGGAWWAKRNTWTKARTRALWSPRWRSRRWRPAAYTRISIAPAATWRTASRNSNSICSPIGPLPVGCTPTRFVCICLPSRTASLAALRRLASGGHRHGAGTVWDDSPAAAEDRGSGADHGAQNLDLDGGRPPRSGGVCGGASDADGRDSANAA